MGPLAARAEAARRRDRQHPGEVRRGLRADLGPRADLTRARLIEQVYEGWRDGDLDRATEPLDPEVVWNAIESAPDAGTYAGLDGARGYMRDWLDDFVIEAGEVIEVVERDDRLFRYSRVRGTGRGSGVPTDIAYSQIYEFTPAGKIARIDEYATRDEGWEEFERRG